jgi:hypothetical protein
VQSTYRAETVIGFFLDITASFPAVIFLSFQISHREILHPSALCALRFALFCWFEFCES